MCKTPKESLDESNLSTEAGPKWTCLNCTAINKDGDTFCVACDNMRGVWICHACDAIYLDGQDACDLCGKILERPPEAEPQEPELKEPDSPEIIEELVAERTARFVELDDITELPQPVNPDNWICPFCNTENPMRRKACIDCLKRRPDLARTPTPTGSYINRHASPELDRPHSPSKSLGS